MAYDPRTHLFANNAAARLEFDIDDSQVQVTLRAGEGSLFPSPGVDEIFKLTVANPATGAREIMHCTARDGDVLTVERGQEDTAAQAFSQGALAQLRLTAGTLEYLQATGGGGGGGGFEEISQIMIVPGDNFGQNGFSSGLAGTAAVDVAAWWQGNVTNRWRLFGLYFQDDYLNLLMTTNVQNTSGGGISASSIEAVILNIEGVEYFYSAFEVYEFFDDIGDGVTSMWRWPVGAAPAMTGYVTASLTQPS